MVAARYFALMFPLGDIFGAAAMAAVLGAGAYWGPGWGMDTRRSSPASSSST